MDGVDPYEAWEEAEEALRLAERRLEAMTAEAVAWRQEAEALRGHLGALYARLDPYDINAGEEDGTA